MNRSYSLFSAIVVALFFVTMFVWQPPAQCAFMSITSPIPPNESGEVPILEYHNITTDDKLGIYEFSSAGFRHDMEWLYQHHYRPINLSDYVKGRIDCPAGTSPFVLTFDDALAGQFYYTAAGTIDPNSAVGILDAMNAEHPDWKSKATFFVLTNEDPKMPAPFTLPRPSGAPSQKGLSAKKMSYLIQDGFEIGNHTLHHYMYMRSMTSAQAEAEFAGGAKGIQKYIPGYDVQTIALPYGRFPNDPSILVSGESNGYRYHNICALAAGWEPAPSPFSKAFRPYRLPRIIPGNNVFKPGGMNTIRYWLKQLELHPSEKFVSDGDPSTFTVPQSRIKYIDRQRLADEHFILKVCGT